MDNHHHHPPLFDAIQQDDYGRCLQLLSNSKRVILYIAFFVIKLLFIVLQVLNRSDGRTTPLDYATILGRAQIIELLISFGAIITNETLALACVGGQPASFLYFLEKKYTHDERDTNGCTLLINLCSYIGDQTSRVESIHILLENGADINAISKDGATAIMRACAFGGQLLIKTLLRGADISIKK